MSNYLEGLDKLDRRLLRELDVNSRQSFAELSKKLRVPAETVRYRMNSLIEREIIEGSLTLIDSGKLGNSYYKVVLKLYNVTESQVLSIIDVLVKHPAVNWVARTDGLYDIAFTIRIQQIIELSDFIDRLKEHYRKYILRMSIAVNIAVEFAVRDFLISQSRLSKVVSYTAPKAQIRPDEIDLGLLRALSNDTRRSGASLAEISKLSVESTLQRVRKLEKSGVIVRYTILPNLNKLGILNYYVFLYFSQASRKRIEEFESYCRQEIHIVYFIKALGEWDYELNIEVEDLERYRSVMMNLTREFWDIVRDYSSLPVAKLYKFTISP